MQPTHLWRNAQNLAPPLLSQVRADHTRYPRAQHLPLVVQKHGGVIIELDETTIRSSDGFLRSDDDSSADVSSSNLDCGRGTGGGR